MVQKKLGRHHSILNPSTIDNFGINSTNAKANKFLGEQIRGCPDNLVQRQLLDFQRVVHLPSHRLNSVPSPRRGDHHDAIRLHHKRLAAGDPIKFFRKLAVLHNNLHCGAQFLGGEVSQKIPRPKTLQSSLDHSERETLAQLTVLLATILAAVC